MASKKEEDRLIGTHAIVTLSDWDVLSSLIAKHSALVKEKSQRQKESDEEEEVFEPDVLSQHEIDDAFNGPMQQFFKHASTTYSAIARVRLHLTMAEDESFKDKRAKLDDADKVPESILKGTSISDLNKIQDELDEIILNHGDYWEQCRKSWGDHLTKHIADVGVSLSDIEVKEFYDPEPISELFERFTTLNIELPKTRKADMDFAMYLTLKTDIAIQSALSRQHLPNAQSDIQKILKQLKSDFTAIQKQQQQILEEQQAEYNTLIANITW